jgi:hypothetical protein
MYDGLFFWIEAINQSDKSSFLQLIEVSPHWIITGLYYLILRLIRRKCRCDLIPLQREPRTMLNSSKEEWMKKKKKRKKKSEWSSFISKQFHFQLCINAAVADTIVAFGYSLVFPTLKDYYSTILKKLFCLLQWSEKLYLKNEMTRAINWFTVALQA